LGKETILNGTDNKSVAIDAKKRGLSVIAKDILKHKEKEAHSVLEIGRLLIEAKEQVGHGEWGKWLSVNVAYSEDTAQNYMKLANGYSSNPELVRILGPTKAGMLLALTPDERNAFLAEKHEVNGEEEEVSALCKTMLKRYINEIKEARETQKNSDNPNKSSDEKEVVTNEVEQDMEEDVTEELEPHFTEENSVPEIIDETEVDFDEDLNLVHLCINNMINYVKDPTKDADRRQDISDVLRTICEEALQRLPSEVVV
jgi:hypothetical protein